MNHMIGMNMNMNIMLDINMSNMYGMSMIISFQNKMQYNNNYKK